MMRIKQSESVAANARVPIFLVDATDGFTPEPGITVSGAEVQTSENGAAFVNFAGTWTEVDGGLYYYTPTAAELSTPGFFCVKVVKAGCRQYMALVQVTTDDPYITRNPRGLVVANGSNSALTFATDLASATTDIYKAPMLVRFLDGALAGSTRPLAATSAYNGTTKFLTISVAYPSTPANGTAFELISV